MNAQMVLTMGQEALWMLLLVSAPVLGMVLVVGLVVSLFQAVTQINEATLAYVDFAHGAEPGVPGGAFCS